MHQPISMYHWLKKIYVKELKQRISTVAISKAAVKKVSNLVLISSDKAVRPTNVMGATKESQNFICKHLIMKIKII